MIKQASNKRFLVKIDREPAVHSKLQSSYKGGAIVCREHNREHATALTAFYQPKTRCPCGTAFSKSK